MNKVDSPRSSPFWNWLPKRETLIAIGTFSAIALTVIGTVAACSACESSSEHQYESLNGDTALVNTTGAVVQFIMNAPYALGLGMIGANYHVLHQDNVMLQHLEEEPAVLKDCKNKIQPICYSPLSYRFEPENCKPMEVVNILSYLFSPGIHSIHSPIPESRAQEMDIILAAAQDPVHGPTFRELGKNLYENYPSSKFAFTIIDSKRCDEAAALADLFYSRFLDKYRCQGVDERNAVYFRSRCGGSSVRWEYVCDYTDYYNPKCEFLRDVHVCIGQLRPPYEPTYCFPDGLIAIHELMHVEELRATVTNEDFDTRRLNENIREIMTVTKELILADEIAKKLDGIDVTVERDYGEKNYSIHGCIIPLGKFINFYRELEKKEKSLGRALVSKKSINFLNCI